MKFVQTTAGRTPDGPVEHDCFWRAVSLAENRPYKEVWQDLKQFARKHAPHWNAITGRDVWDIENNGTNGALGIAYLEQRGWEYIDLEGAGVWLNNLPKVGNMIVAVPNHITYISNGTVYDDVLPKDRPYMERYNPPVHGVFVRKQDLAAAA